MAILLPSAPGQDILRWQRNSIGEYSVKSGYQLITAQPAPTIFPTVTHTFIWKINCPSKLKVFLWKAAHQGLPSFTVLHRASLTPTAAQCSQCSLEDEMNDHILFQCP
ncbi:hypothetical protein MKW98_029297 [Papaver atlanticum]|uniref:Reverse transcriptase zinc-binding domain-containing protein n=1 Tax=Papaver atlanticum TaxID=357466 RepID=A0AAD4SI75_9MAGN|nr:hypothetical protein MKW98_029297 [Papaver atlanticum]